MDKYTVLKEIFDIEGVSEKIKACSKISEQQLLAAISKDSYNLKEELGLTATTVTRYLKLLFPDRPSTTAKLCNYLLDKYGYKQCKKCACVKAHELFYNNKSYKDGLSSYCKECQAKEELKTAKQRTAKYRAAKLQRTPPWLSEKELRDISLFYSNCPEGFHVDHIVPLQGENVSGLHVLNNLQYLPAIDNIRKNNKFSPL